MVSYAEFKYNPCIGSIGMDNSLALAFNAFKYNPCIGSIKL